MAEVEARRTTAILQARRDGDDQREALLTGWLSVLADPSTAITAARLVSTDHVPKGVKAELDAQVLTGELTCDAVAARARAAAEALEVELPELEAGGDWPDSIPIDPLSRAR